MGDEGRLYVSEDIVPAYKSLCRDADLIVPNSFEAELLSDTKISDMKSLVTAITKMHEEYRIPHIIVTSLHISPKTGRRNSNAETIAVVGSSCRTGMLPSPFQALCNADHFAQITPLASSQSPSPLSQYSSPAPETCSPPSPLPVCARPS